MAQISFAGAFTASTLTVPDVYLNILPPQQQIVSPATFGLLGYVGAASWGPVGAATLIGSTTALTAYFGYPVVRPNDLITAAMLALEEQGASGLGANLMLVRASDGTDTAASSLVQSASSSNYALRLTGYYTGKRGNSISATVSTGGIANSWRVVLSLPPLAPEIYDNITGTGSAFWVNVAQAINQGQGYARGPSEICIASAGLGANATITPIAGTYTFSGGTDGDATLVSANFIGVDTAPRSGIYAFRGTGLSDLAIADFYDSSMDATLISFGQSEGIYVHTSGPPSETVQQARTTKNTQGSDNPWLKRWLGDWGYWQDTYNKTERLLGPATFGASLMSTVPPMLTALNKPSRSVVATQRSRGNLPYGGDELAVLVQSGLDTICNPIPAGQMFGGRTGKNASSQRAIDGDNWPRLTSFLARSLAGNGALGTLIGQTITDDFFRRGFDMIDAFLAPMKNPQNGPPMIENYAIQFSRANNLPSQTGAGIVVANVQIRYLGVASIFLVNMSTGQSVVIPEAANSSAVAAALAGATL